MGEQPLPPYGACLLGSFNLTKYIYEDSEPGNNGAEIFYTFDYKQFKHDIPHVVRAMDNVIDVAKYPLPQQEEEAKNKRRMGLGITGLANAGEILGFSYGSPLFLEFTESILGSLRDIAYETSIELAKEKGVFPLFNKEYYGGTFFETLPKHIQFGIRNTGIRNSHLLSIAPTGTISLSADNVSSGIEPVFSHHYKRRIQTYEGEKTVDVDDYAYKVYGVKGKAVNDLSVDDHLAVLTTASRYVDSACSKTINVGNEVTWDQFKDVYLKAYEGGASGVTTFRAAGKRMAILLDKDEDTINEEGAACYIDAETGIRTCE